MYIFQFDHASTSCKKDIKLHYQVGGSPESAGCTFIFQATVINDNSLTLPHSVDITPVEKRSFLTVSLRFFLVVF